MDDAKYENQGQDEVDHDAVWDRARDQEAEERAEREMLRPAGSYQSIPPFAVTAKEFPESEDGRPARTVFTASGTAIRIKDEKGQLDDKGHRERFSIQYSDDLQKVVNNNGEEVYDGKSKRYIEIKKAYQATYGTAPKTRRDVKAFLEGEVFGIRSYTFDGNEGPMVGLVVFPVKRG